MSTAICGAKHRKGLKALKKKKKKKKKREKKKQVYSGIMTDGAGRRKGTLLIAPKAVLSAQ